jgi:hypothetical protein
VLTLEDPYRFERSRCVGAYLGLVPARDQSGDRDPQKRISKEGDHMLRRLLVGSAHYILGPFGSDSDLRRHGEKIASRGAKNSKKRAVVAVARKLSVLLHRLWVSGEVYDPLYNANRRKSKEAAWTEVMAQRSKEEVKIALQRLEAVMNSIRKSLGMRETEIAREPRWPWNPHLYGIFAQVHNTL